MKTVIGFDSWTGGASKFARLVPALRAEGYELLLLHLGSWGGDDRRPLEENISGLKVRDIAYYRGMGFDEILDLERPVAVLFLSNDVFAHRAFNRYSLHRAIPTLHLYHGLVGVQAVKSGKIYKVNVLSQAKFVLQRIPKALSKVWPCYVKALVRTGARSADWRRFVNDIFVLAKGKYISHAAADSRASCCAVYTKADVSHAVQKYGHEVSHVHVVGNPDIQMFGLHDEQIGSAVNVGISRSSSIVYVDTGLIYAGMVYDDADDFFQHIMTTKQSLANQGFQFSIKLHPQHFRTDFPSRLQAAGVEVLRNDEFVARLQTCAAALVEPSTAAMIPGLVGVPLLLARFGKLSSQVYGDVLVSHPRARYLDDVSHVSTLLSEEAAAFQPAALAQWIDENAGPLPADQMPARVAAIVTELATKGASDKCAA